MKAVLICGIIFLAVACAVDQARIVSSASATESEIAICQGVGRDAGLYSAYATCMRDAGLEQ